MLIKIEPTARNTRSVWQQSHSEDGSKIAQVRASFSFSASFSTAIASDRILVDVQTDILDDFYHGCLVL